MDGEKMGEIKIKSGNLFDGELEQGGISVSGDIRTSSVRVRGYAYVKPQTAYTIASNKAFRMCYGYNDDGTNINKVGRIFDNNSGNNKLSTFTTPEGCNYIGFAIWNGDETNIVPTDVQNLILVESTYTSETIPEYQPYFLNKPAHQFTNGECIDIPTHHFINNRWQGELTSQSPLKFRADGEMLDWRVEGKTSGNLFNVNRLPSNTWTTDTRYYMNGGNITSKTVIPEAVTISVNNNTLSVTTDGGAGAGFLVEVKPSTEYRLVFTKSELLNSNQTSCTYALVDTSETIGQMQAIYGNADGVVITTDSNTKYVYFVFRKAAGTISYSNIMLNEGSTALPYEPYGGVGDYDETEQKYRIPVTVNGVTTNLFTDHQLMDGDSIDFATDQTAIPLATGNNTLSVDTAVQPSKVFVKFEG